LNAQTKVKSGDRTPVTGIYLPDVDYSFPALLIKSDDDLLGEAPEASIEPPEGGNDYAPTIWTLVERVADESDMPTAPSLVTPIRLRVEGGESCPQTGYWFTPAQLNSRRHFKEEELMPVVSSDYGSTIWQWDPHQAA
jgi:hypothetical protein